MGIRGAGRGLYLNSKSSPQEYRSKALCPVGGRFPALATLALSVPHDQRQRARIDRYLVLDVCVIPLNQLPVGGRNHTAPAKKLPCLAMVRGSVLLRRVSSADAAPTPVPGKRTRVAHAAHQSTDRRIKILRAVESRAHCGINQPLPPLFVYGQRRFSDSVYFER